MTTIGEWIHRVFVGRAVFDCVASPMGIWRYTTTDILYVCLLCAFFTIFKSDINDFLFDPSINGNYPACIVCLCERER